MARRGVKNMTQLTFNQKLNLIEKLVKLREKKNPFYRFKKKKLRKKLLASMKGNPEFIGNFVLTRSNTPEPYLQIYTKESFEKAQRYLERFRGIRRAKA